MKNRSDASWISDERSRDTTDCGKLFRLCRQAFYEADSILVRLIEIEFEAGIRAVRSEIATGPITELINFLVFEK